MTIFSSEQKSKRVTLVVNKVVVMGFGMPLIVVLLDEATATQLAPIWVLGASAEQAAQEAGGGRASAGAAGAVAPHVVMVALAPRSEDVLEQAAIVGW